jgi:UDP-2-acetamido-3-amino-2,3-dideoxy-glucuronate N-acetyltransferase
MGTPTSSPVIHPTAVVDQTAVLGEGTVVWSHACILAGAVLGRGCRVGHGAFVDRGVRVGNGVVIHNHANIYRPVELEDDVFIGPHVVFVNDPEPHSRLTRDVEHISWKVRRGATVGASVTVLSDVSLAEHCLIGAGSVVTRPTAPYGVYRGSPARLFGYRCACGVRIGIEHGLPERCTQCGNHFQP